MRSSCAPPLLMCTSYRSSAPTRAACFNPAPREALPHRTRRTSVPVYRHAHVGLAGEHAGNHGRLSMGYANGLVLDVGRQVGAPKLFIRRNVEIS
jgi:hypothetical protein